MANDTKQKYKCARCNYECNLKKHMRQHLFLRNKNGCPAVNNIELTDDVKRIILNNRVYHPCLTKDKIENTEVEKLRQENRKLHQELAQTRTILTQIWNISQTALKC